MGGAELPPQRHEVGTEAAGVSLLQAEKVLSLPLDLRLNTDYRYRLVGVEAVDGRPCFALRFDPIEEERTLYRGTVWIDRETYLKVKAQTIQTRLSSPVVSSEEIQYFSSVGTVADHDIHLLTRLVGRQIMLIAGRNLLVERGVRFEAFQLNPTDFAAQREAARASDNVMYRDTDEGLRYLVKRDGVRVVQTATTTATAGLMGITYDPSYDYPLPLIGINYLNFNFLGKDNQLAVVFGGVLALVNLQRPKLVGQHVDGSLDLFAIAVKGNDRTYDGTGELTGQRLTTRPFSTGINLGWQMAEFQKLVASYQFRFDAFSVDAATATTFRPPVSTVTNGVGLSWEWKQAGYSFLAGGTSYRRARWEPWGDPGDYRPADQSYLKYSASLSKDYFFGFQKVHLNTAYYGGRDLDRFSAYQFGLFDDNRVHGVPSAGVRFGELGMFRGSYSFNLFDQYRLDLFPRPGVRAGSSPDDRVAGPDRRRDRRKHPRALEHAAPRRRGEELPAVPVSPAGIARCAVSDPETAMSMAPLRPHPKLDRYYGSDSERPGVVSDLFDEGAPYYEWICRVMSFGTGERYRRQALRDAGLAPGMRVLDVATGTGLVLRAAVEMSGGTGPGGWPRPERRHAARVPQELRSPALAGTWRAPALRRCQLRHGQHGIRPAPRGRPPRALRRVPPRLEARRPSADSGDHATAFRRGSMAEPAVPPEPSSRPWPASARGLPQPAG